jgi:hypothetical protein
MRSNREYAIKFWGAVEQPDGSYLHKDGERFWYNSAGERHREDGPAIIGTNGKLSWVLHSYRYSFAEWLIKANISDEDAMLLRLRYG